MNEVNEVNTTQQAFNAGFGAAKDGRWLRDCPPLEGELARHWEAGWRVALCHLWHRQATPR